MAALFMMVCVGSLCALCLWCGLGELEALHAASGVDGGVRHATVPAFRSIGTVARGVSELLPPSWGPAAHGMLAEFRALVEQKGLGAHVPDDTAARGALMVLSAASGALAVLISASASMAIVGAAAPAGFLLLRSARRLHERAQTLDAAMPEAFGALAIALGSGHSLSQAMRYVGNHAVEPVRSEFMRVSFAIDCGVAPAQALDALLERLPSPGLGLVALALKVSQRTGAPLRDLLSEAARMAGERVELARLLDVKTSQARMSASLVALMPVGMVGFLMLCFSDFRQGAATPVGALCVGAALVLNGVAWLIIRRIMRVEL